MTKEKAGKVQRKEINHAEVAHQAKLNNLGKDTVYLLIHRGGLTPNLSTESDRRTLKAFGLVVRSRPYARQILARFTLVERLDLHANAGMTEKEVRIKKTLAAAAKEGKVITTLQMCADVYSREGKVYSHGKPDYALIGTITKIRRSLKNQRYYFLKNESPVCSEALAYNRQLEMEQEPLAFRGGQE